MKKIAEWIFIFGMAAAAGLLLAGCSAEYMAGKKPCTLADCNEYAEVGQSFCEKHKCHEEKCKNQAVTGGEYCVEHTCRTEGCFERSWRYCSEHTCDANDCYNEVVEGTDYCWEHQDIWECIQTERRIARERSTAQQEEPTTGTRYYKSTGKDPFDAQDYMEADDFYYDHPDDFYDYEDAEDYLEEYWGDS